MVLILVSLLIFLSVALVVLAFSNKVSIESFFTGRKASKELKTTIASSQPEKCPQDSTHFECLERYYSALVTLNGVTAAFDDLRMRQEKDEFIRDQCHPLAHVIGRAAAMLYPSVCEAFNDGDATCWSGYYHGVMETTAENIGRDGIEQQLNDMCAGIPRDGNNWLHYFYCVHGLGHDIMAILNDELFESLEICDTLRGSWERDSCVGGAFMENVIADHSGHKTKYLDAERPLYPCTDVQERFKEQCYLNQSSYMLKILGGDFVQAFDLCGSAGEPYANRCYESLGRDAVSYGKSEPSLIFELCDKAITDEQRAHCVIGVVDFLVTYEPKEHAEQFCAIFLGSLQSECTARIESHL
ncbi:MAG: hypothetical protein G01um10148_132 [Parcubacteria group bacterium Gr01-1014_8]|nr:MAG: hypothetical protein G01um10148_132 [Parcubacteria group bacterium Gr01-1014_8]